MIRKGETGMKLNMTITKEKSGEELQHSYKDMEFVPDSGEENSVINLYPDLLFEELEGFGGAITDSAAYIYSRMYPAQKKKIMDMYFSPKQMGYRIVRIHMDSCDFSTGMYEAMSDPDDEELKSFDFSRTESYIIPMLRDAEASAGRKLEIMLTPWSPPAFMKTNGSRIHGGSLKLEYYALWAKYICRYISEFRKRGFLVKRISLQNEPVAVQTWDSCTYTAEEEKRFLEEAMYPALESHGMTDIEVFIWDHNKERILERVREIYDMSTKHMITGAACHWYSGDHFDSLSLVRKLYPELKLVVSESCIEFSKFDLDDSQENAMRLSHEIIGDLNHGVTAFYDWNLLLDEKGGPNHVGNYCLAPFLYDLNNQLLMPQLIQKHLYHFSHFIQRGAQRMGFSCYTHQLDVTAYRNPDGTVIIVILNHSGQPHPVNIRIKGQITQVKIPAKAIGTGIITGV